MFFKFVQTPGEEESQVLDSCKGAGMVAQGGGSKPGVKKRPSRQSNQDFSGRGQNPNEATGWNLHFLVSTREP